MVVTASEAVRNARARERLAARHVELREVLDHWAGELATAADRGGSAGPVRNLLRAFLIDEVLPHARAEERTLYRAVRRDPGVGLLVQALVGEHRLLASMAVRLGEQPRPGGRRGAGRGDQRPVRQSRRQGGIPPAAGA